MGLLTLVLSPTEAASLLIVPSFVTNVWQLFTGSHFGALARRLWLMMAGIVVGTLAGAGFMQADAAGWTVIGGLGTGTGF